MIATVSEFVSNVLWMQANVKQVDRTKYLQYLTYSYIQSKLLLAKLAENFTAGPWTQHAAGHIYLLGVFNRGPARRTIAHAVAAPGANAQQPAWNRFLYVRARRLSGAAQRSRVPRVPRGVEVEAAQAMQQGAAACQIS